MTAAQTGRRARRAGDSAEVEVLRAGERYYVLGLACLWRVGTRAVWGRSGRAVVKGAPVDFLGLLRGGRALALEVKSCARPSVPLRPQGKPLVSPGEAVALSWAAAEGAVSAVVIRARGQWWRLDWADYLEAVATVESQGRASLTPADLARHGRCLPVFEDGAPQVMDGLTAPAGP